MAITISGSKLKIDLGGAMKETEAILRRRVLAMANYLQIKTQLNLGHSGWGSESGGKISKWKNIKDEKGKKKSIWYRPSKPGQFPHLDTGTLRASIYREGPTVTDTDIEARVGVNVGYGVDHELGDRPFLRRTAIEEEETLRKIADGSHSGSALPAGWTPPQ